MRVLTFILASCFALSQANALLPKTTPQPATKQKPAIKQEKLKQKNSRHWHYGSSTSSSSSSSSSSSRSARDLAHCGSFTQNLGLDVEFDPTTLASVLVDIPDTDPPASAMIFDTNEPGSPLHVIHPVPGPDYTRFRIEEEGTYLITWTFTIGCTTGSCLNGAFVQLYDAATDVALNPNPMQFVDTEVFAEFTDSETVSGQQLIYLPQGAEVQLRLIPAAFDFGDLWIANPSMTLTRIAN